MENVRTLYALGYVDAGRTWYLHREASLGNPLRTDVPLYARAWTSVLEVELWIDALPATAKAQLLGRERSIFPLSVTVGAPVKVIAALEVEEPAPAPVLAPAAKPPRPPASTPAVGRVLFV